MARIEIVMPQMGESITTGTITYPNVPGNSGNVLTTDGTGTAS